MQNRARRLARAAALVWIAIGFVPVTPLVALDAGRPADSYSISGWFTEDGLPSNKIRSVVQARDGYLWLATEQGLARFDGSQFTVFNGKSHPQLSGGGFFAALEAPDGALWFGGDRGLFRWQNGQFDRFTTEDGLAHDYVRGLALTRDGAVVACTRRGFSFVRDGRITTPGGHLERSPRRSSRLPRTGGRHHSARHIRRAVADHRRKNRAAVRHRGISRQRVSQPGGDA